MSNLDYCIKRQPLMLDSVVWLIALALTLIALFFPALRYLAYLVPYLALVQGLAEGRLNIPTISRPFLILLLAGILFLPIATTEGYKDLFFIVSGISISFVLRKVPFNPNLLFVIFLFGTLLFAYLYGGLESGIVFDPIHSQSSFEGNFAFLFGLLTIYSMSTKRWKLFWLSLIASIFTLKRIVILAEITCIFFMLVPERIAKRIVNPIFMVTLNLLFVLTVTLYALHTFDNTISLFTGQSANQLGMGRQDLYEQVAKFIADNPLRFIFIGAGPGAAYETLGLKFAILGHTNLHSDVLKIFYEYGLIIFCGIFFIGYIGEKLSLRLLFLYANIIYVSDNVLIYHFFLFFLCVFGLAIENHEVHPRS